MADKEKGNINPNYTAANLGLNMDQVSSQVNKGEVTYALNAAIENYDDNSVNYQNEPGNELCITFPEGFVLIGTHSIIEQDKHIFFITNPITEESQIGFMENNDCIYHTLVDAKCLNFNINYPIHKIVHRITNCDTQIYWTDGYNPRRYLSLDEDNIPKIIKYGTALCDASYTDELDCNQLNVQPNFSIPLLVINDIRNTGDLKAGTYQFAIQYADASGNPLTSYYSVTNPVPIADNKITTINYDYSVGKSIAISITDLEVSGLYRYYNIAVIKTINAISSVELIGTYSIEDESSQVIYTGQSVTNIRLSIQDIFEKYPYYEIAQDLTTARDILIWDQLSSIDRVNYQQIANKITLQWESWRIPATENYANEINATNYRGYLRDEVYAFEIVFLLANGKQTDGFHIPGRERDLSESLWADIPDTDPDFIGAPDYYEGGIGYSPYWKIYNTATVESFSPSYDASDPSYKGPYQNGEFAYWESTEEYPCNKEVWGELAGQKIRHHKFPDVEVSSIFESKVFVDRYSMVMGNDAIFPIGVKINPQQIRFYIDSSDLTKEQKDEIVGFKIVRGDRSTNKSIVAKGILRNVNKYERDDTEYYFPNYPYNDLREDPFINLTNNAYKDECEPFSIEISKLIYDFTLEREVAKVQYIDCNTNRVKTQVVDTIGKINICAVNKPIITFGKGTVSYLNYDLWNITWASDTGSVLCGGYRVEYNDVTNGITRKWVAGWPIRDNFDVRVVVGSVPTCVEFCNRGFLCGDVHLITFKERVTSDESCILASTLDSPPLPAITDNYRQVFNSPETSFGQPFLGDILKLESVIFGKGKAHFTEVKNNAKYRLISKEAQKKALDSSAELGAITEDFSTEAMFAAYQSYLTIYLNNITRKNYAYSFNSIASYDYCNAVPSGLGIKQRNLDIARYLIPAVVSVDDDNDLNNYQRESSVYLKTDANKSPLPFPDKSPNMLQGESSILTEHSRFTISQSGQCNNPGTENDIEVVSYYASMKKHFVNQWGQIYSYDTIDTGFQQKFDTDYDSFTVFGGDTYISRFAFKTKLPFFIDNRVGALDDSDIFYDEIGNVGYPKYWHSSRSIFEDYTIINQGDANNSPGTLVNIISYKAHNFDCPNDTTITLTDATDISISTTTSTTTVVYSGGLTSEGDSERTFYDGFFYLFAYGIPNFYCESSYNLDLRQAFNNREGDFWPHVSTSIPDDWLQESFVSIANDNTYYYNTTFSKQNKENTFSHLPADWDNDMCMTHYPFRAIYSDPEDSNADNRVNTWRIYRAISYYDFPQNYGELTSLDGIQNRAILARFENKTLLYDNLITIDTSNPQAAYIGNSSLFKGGPPIDFADTDLGYMGSQHKFILKIPHGQITIDAKRGHVFLIQGTQAIDISRFGSGMNRFLTDHLPFEILKTFPDIDIDNHFKGLGLHGVYDTKFERVIITKLDYIPLSDDIIYDEISKEFYYNDPELGRQLINLNDLDYFCNKSWTLSYNMNTQKWISFHTYLPNWYIGENNFYYSGLNDCCGDFEFIAGAMPSDFDCRLWGYVLSDGAEIDCEIEAECVDCTSDFITTTTTTSSSSTTTTSTTFHDDCEIDGEIIEIVDDSTTTTSTTICVRPEDLQDLIFITGFTNSGTGITVDSTVDKETACDVMHFLQVTPNPEIVPTYISVQTYGIGIGNYIYVNNGTDDCSCIPDGWYFTDETSSYDYVFYVENCIIVELYSCEETTSTSTSSTTTTSYPYDCEIDGEVIDVHTTTTTTTLEPTTTTTTSTTCYLEVILVSPTTTTTSTTACPIDADLIEIDCEESTTTTTTSSSTTTTTSTTVEPTTSTTTSSTTIVEPTTTTTTSTIEPTTTTSTSSSTTTTTTTVAGCEECNLFFGTL